MSRQPPSDNAERLGEALSHMSRKARITFLLHARRGLSLDRIAVRLGVSRRRAKRYFIAAIRCIDRAWREP
jgi:DNA-directed RNA polymerase specialized sigma24 family protein